MRSRKRLTACKQHRRQEQSGVNFACCNEYDAVATYSFFLFLWEWIISKSFHQEWGFEVEALCLSRAVSKPYPRLLLGVVPELSCETLIWDTTSAQDCHYWRRYGTKLIASRWVVDSDYDIWVRTSIAIDAPVTTEMREWLPFICSCTSQNQNTETVMVMIPTAYLTLASSTASWNWTLESNNVRVSRWYFTNTPPPPNCKLSRFSWA